MSIVTMPAILLSNDLLCIDFCIYETKWIEISKDQYHFFWINVLVLIELNQYNPKYSINRYCSILQHSAAFLFLDGITWFLLFPHLLPHLMFSLSVHDPCLHQDMSADPDPWPGWCLRCLTVCRPPDTTELLGCCWAEADSQLTFTNQDFVQSASMVAD